MNIVINNSFEFGQKLYRLSCKSKNVYKPCTLCNNTRKVVIKDPDDDREYNVPCPKCSGRQIKGDDRYYISVKTYSMEVLEIDSLVVTEGGNVEARVKSSNYGSFGTITLHQDDDRTSLTEKSKGFGGSDIVYYTSKADCSAEMRRLNKIEKEKAEKFLRGESDE